MIKTNKKDQIDYKYIWGFYTARSYLKINLLKKLSLKRNEMNEMNVLCLLSGSRVLSMIDRIDI